MTRTRRRLAGALLATAFALSLAVAPGHAHLPDVAEGTAGGSPTAAPPACRSTHCRATQELLPTMGTMPTAGTPARILNQTPQLDSDVTRAPLAGDGGGRMAVDQSIRGAGRP